MARCSYVIKLSETERDRAIRAARLVHRISLQAHLKFQIRKLLSDAEMIRPDLFGTPMADLMPVDRTIYRHLTEEGRRTDEDLVREMGLSMATIRRSLHRLKLAGLIEEREQGGQREAARGFAKRIYISFAED